MTDEARGEQSMAIGRPSWIVSMEAGRQMMGSDPDVDSDQQGMSVTWGSATLAVRLTICSVMLF